MALAITSPSEGDWAAWLAEEERRSCEVYKLRPELLIAEYRRERETTRGYHGRELLELLQNAADAARELKVSGKVRIVVTPEGLVFANTGKPFSRDGVQSLRTANLSPKRQGEAVVIGDKGLGFRSILNWTDSPLISSGALGIAFLPGYSSDVIDRLVRESQDIAKRVEDERKIAGLSTAPRLAFPQWIPNWEKHDWPVEEGLRSIATACAKLRSEGFDTVIGMPFSNPRAYHEAVEQAKELKREFLLLVDSIDHLEIQHPEGDHRIWSCDRTDEPWNLLEGGQIVSSWTVFSFDGDVPDELLDDGERRRNRFRITIAAPEGNQTGPGCLFCFFPTEVDLPLPLLAHATVELDETRKHVNDTRANRYILEVMAERIAELAEQHVGRQGADPWVGCRLVTAVKSWGSELDKFKIPDVLRKAAMVKKLVPVLRGGHLSASEVKSAPGNSAKWWPARLFPELAAFETKEHRGFAQHLGVKPLWTEQVVKRLVDATQLTLNERANAIAGLLQSTPPPAGDNLAKLLCDLNRTPLSAGVSAILQSVGKLSPLPEWAKIRSLHPELRRKLGDLLGTKDSRELQQKLQPFGVIEFSLAALIRPVMAEANRQVRDRPQDEALIRGESLLFLWRTHHTLGGDTGFPSEATVKLLNQEGIWTEPKQLYLGQGFGQEGNVTQDLYGCWAKGKLLDSAALVALESIDPDSVICFLLWLGVQRWPREIKAENSDPKFLEAVKANFRYPVAFGDCLFDSPTNLPYLWITQATTIDGLPEILNYAAPEAVLAWLTLDPRSASWMRISPYHARLNARPKHKQDTRQYSGSLESYIHWQIATNPWLPSTDGTKQAPQNCLIGDCQLDALFPSPAKPDPELLDRYGISTGLSDAFRHAGVLRSLAELGRDNLYRLLLELPERYPDGKASCALCRWFVTNEASVLGSAGPYQEKFFRQGRIWGAKQGLSGFFRLTELRHVDQEGLPPALTVKLPIADLPKRIGAQRVENLLGIKPLDRSRIVQKLVFHQPGSEQANRAAWFDEAKPYIKRLRQTQTKQEQAVGALDRLSLVICDELRVQMTYERVVYDHTAEEWEWFVFSDHLYVRGDLEDSIDLLSDAVGVAIAYLFGMTEGDAFAKILHCEPKSRRRLLRRMCGDEFHEEVEAASSRRRPAYVGPILTPIAAPPSKPDRNPKEQQSEIIPEGGSDASDQGAKSPGVSPIAHEPRPPAARRKIVVRNLQRTQTKLSGTRTMVDDERSERMGVAFEEQDEPKRYALKVGHLTGLDAPGVDLLSFDSEEDLEVFRNPKTRDLGKVQRFIEVKGRSSSTAKIELKGNELKAARKYGDRYYLYRFYEEAKGEFYVSILQNPMAAEEAKETVIEVDLDRAKATCRFRFIVDDSEVISDVQHPEALGTRP